MHETGLQDLKQEKQLTLNWENREIWELQELRLLYKVYWLIPLNSDLGQLPSKSNLASIRLRSAVCINAFYSAGLSIGYGESIPSDINKVVIGKIGAHDISIRATAWLRQISKAKGSGARIFLDYTDHHLGFNSSMREFYEQALVAMM